MTECQISARAAPKPGWPSSQPVAGLGNATAVYCGVGPEVRVRVVGAWPGEAVLAGTVLAGTVLAGTEQAARRDRQRGDVS